MIADNNIEANVYPHDNGCFTHGMTEILKSIEDKLYIPLSSVWSEFVFIDLSIFTMRYLVENEDEWMGELKDKKIVFIANSSLGTLANYWFCNFDMFGIVYLNDIRDIEKTLAYVVNGRFLKKDMKYRSLTQKEMTILKKMSQGVPPKLIARIEHCSVKTIYSHRKNIYGKLNIIHI